MRMNDRCDQFGCAASESSLTIFSRAGSESAFEISVTASVWSIASLRSAFAYRPRLRLSASRKRSTFSARAV